MWQKDLFARSNFINDSMYLIKNNDVYKLDEISSFIWGKMDGHTSLEEIVQEISINYSINKTIVKEDTLEFIESLELQGLVKKV